MANLTATTQFRLMAHETKNNGSPTLLEAAVYVKDWGQVTWLLMLGAVAAGAKVNWKVEESDDGSTGWADIAGKAISEIPDTGDNGIYALEVEMAVARKAYQRAIPVVDDGTPGADLVVVCALSRYSPNVAVVAPLTLEQVV